MTPPTSTSDTTDCPVCGQGYDQRIVVERGDRWGDIYAGAPLSFFRKYRRRCSAQYDVEREERVDSGSVVVYFHEGRQPMNIF